MFASDSKISRRNACPLCGVRVDKAKLLANTTYMCSGCSLVYNEMLPKTERAIKWEDYTFDDDVLRYDLSRFEFFKDFWNYVCHITGKAVGSMLDVGCGRGLLLKIAGLQDGKLKG